ncbi:SMC family ATPase [Pelagibius sp. Alg239-R121]|uniref:AAA family ATPase n=1 Tax=Pelagibius sp. Alg239-R121 TaxID=2993448 RepID=UPI0024A72F8B|nr:SMC family ATPase [Pelagibius sp. Alg239-R121]
MQAFGPYADREVVDFKAALANGLFGIYGPTGSGKSSIFSAMAFALFGESAKDDQDPQTLRSDHARPDCLTEVELVFEVAERRYLVRRRPEQVRPALKGGGETKERHAAWLFDVTGISLDDLSDENSGKIIAEKKTTLVEEAMTERLGYGAEQFRQIILLPQGRFETFLTAKTKDRLATLRDLFDVSLYKRLAQKLRDDAKEAEEKVKNDRLVCAGRLRHDGFESPDALKDGISEANNQQSLADSASKQASETATKAEKALTDALNTDKAFKEKIDADKNLSVIEARSVEIDKSEVALKAALRAKSMLDLDNAAAKAHEVVQRSLIEKQRSEQARVAAADAAAQAAIVLSTEKQKSGELDRLRRHCEDLNRHRETLISAQGLSAIAKTAEDAAGKAEDAFVVSQELHTKLVNLREETAKNVTAAQSAATQRAQLTAEITSVQQMLGIARQYEKAGKAVADSTLLLETSSQSHERRSNELQSAETTFAAAEDALSGAQAVHLSEKLIEGDPCPVCGSSAHPSPAQGSAESAGLDHAFRDAKVALDTARNKEAAARASVASARAALSERRSALEALKKPAKSIKESEDEGDALKSRLESLGPAAEIPELEAALGRLLEEISQAVKALEVERLKRDVLKTEFALARQNLLNGLATIPKELQTSEALENAIAKVVASIKSQEAALEDAVKKERSASEALIAAQKDGESAARAYSNAIDASETADKTLAARLAENGFTPEQYQVHKANISQIDALETNIKAHAEQLAAAKDRVSRATVAIEGIKRPDLGSLTQARDVAIKARDETVKSAAAAKARVDHLVGLQASIAAELKRIAKAEVDSGPLVGIAAAFNGQNPQRVELETFAIGAMFDRVLEAANLRLLPMSSGRYSLEREQEGGKGTGRRGLGISVYDVHTGRLRATSTLSGGETFMAALALALGLSDVVESVSGGIRLDTIFIDEGFGSLDSETLDQALQVLQDLVGQSRAVGLISHVELVQQAIPNGFQIRKSVSGSHVEMRTI